jgi:hypothetical protein
MHKFQHAIVIFLTLRCVEVYAHDGLGWSHHS